VNEHQIRYQVLLDLGKDFKEFKDFKDFSMRILINLRRGLSSAIVVFSLFSATGCGLTSPGNAEFEKALDLFDHGEYQKALEAFKDADSKVHATAYAIGQGNCKLALNDFAGAEAEFNKLAKTPHEDLEWVAAQLGQGVLLLEQGKPQAALVPLSAGLQHKGGFGFESTRAKLFMAQALSLAKLGKAKEAVASADEALKLLPSSAITHRLKAQVLRLTGKPGEALVYLEKAVERDDGAYLTLVERGLTKKALGKFQDALTDLDQAIKSDPRFAVAYEERAAVQAKLGNKQAASKDLVEAKAKAINGKNWDEFSPDIVRP